MRSISILALALVAAAAPGLSAPLHHARQNTDSNDQSGAINVSKYTSIAKDIAEGVNAIEGAIQGGVDIYNNIKNGRREDDANQSGAISTSEISNIVKDVADGVNAVEGVVQGGVDIYHSIKNGRREDDANQSGAISSSEITSIVKDVAEGVNAVEGAVQGGINIYHNIVNGRDDTVEFSSLLARYYDTRDASADESGAIDFGALKTTATDIIDAGKAIGNVISGGKAIYDSIKNGQQQQQQRDMHALLARAILNSMAKRAVDELD